MTEARAFTARPAIRRRARFCLLALGAATAAACASPSTSPPKIQIDARQSSVEVIGLPPLALATLAATPLPEDEWQALLRVSVKDDPDASDPTTRPPVSGKYTIAGNVLRFTPLFPFDEGRQYDVTLDPARLPGSSNGEPWRASPLTLVVGRPAVDRQPSTTVTRVYPSGDAVPANLLRLYLHFSAPMDRRSGYEHVTLVDDRGEEVIDAFLPLDADFWNDDRTRYTVFFDPGRVKRGILPNRQMGRALGAGRRYTLVVKREWRDGRGLPLAKDFRHELRATPAIERALSMADWRIEAPAAGTRAPLVVTFPAPLDHALLRRALAVSRRGAVIDGDIAIEHGETGWRLTPREAWLAGEYDLVAIDFLEDLAGNRIGRPFEVDNFERTDATSEPARTTRPFRIVAADGT